MSTDEVTSPHPTHASRSAWERSGYWYSPEARTSRAIELLNAMRAYRAAEREMRRRTQDSMKMGETDLAATRHLLAAARRGEAVSPGSLAAALAISGAAASVLIDRLVRQGYVERQANPDDRRGVIIVTTPELEREVRTTLGSMHTEMLAIAESLEPDATLQIVLFLERMTTAMASHSGPA